MRAGGGEGGDDDDDDVSSRRCSDDAVAVDEQVQSQFNEGGNVVAGRISGSSSMYSAFANRIDGIMRRRRTMKGLEEGIVVCLGMVEVL